MAGKFQPNWEGPYIVTRVGESGSYALDKLDGTPVHKMWNAMHLKRYYQEKDNSVSNRVSISNFNYPRPGKVDVLSGSVWLRPSWFITKSREG